MQQIHNEICQFGLLSSKKLLLGKRRTGQATVTYSGTIIIVIHVPHYDFNRVTPEWKQPLANPVLTHSWGGDGSHVVLAFSLGFHTGMQASLQFIQFHNHHRSMTFGCTPKEVSVYLRPVRSGLFRSHRTKRMLCFNLSCAVRKWVFSTEHNQLECCHRLSLNPRGAVASMPATLFHGLQGMQPRPLSTYF